jgi:hypothetical protein
MSGDEDTKTETSEQADEDTKTETSEQADEDTKTETPELSDEGKEQVEQMQAAYDDDRPTAVLPGTDGTITGVAVNEWLDDDGNPKFGKDEQKDKAEEQDKPQDEDEPQDEDNQREDAS